MILRLCRRFWGRVRRMIEGVGDVWESVCSAMVRRVDQRFVFSIDWMGGRSRPLRRSYIVLLRWILVQVISVVCSQHATPRSIDMDPGSTGKPSLEPAGNVRSRHHLRQHFSVLQLLGSLYIQFPPSLTWDLYVR